MVSTHKTKAQLLEELAELRAKVDAGEKSRAPWNLKEEYFWLMADRAPMGISIVHKGILVYTNSACQEMLGYDDISEILGKPLTTFIAPQYHQEMGNRIERRVQGENVSTSYEAAGLRRDGSEFPFHADLNLIQTPDGPMIVAFFTDISERKKAEAELRQRNAELTTLNQIGQALNQYLEPSKILSLVFDMIGQVLDNKNLFIALYDEATREISFPIYTVNGQIKEVPSRSFSNGLTEYILRTKSPLLSHDVMLTQHELGISAIGIPAQCFLGVPMLAGDKAIGILAVQDYENTDTYQQNHLELLMTVAAQAAGALENARFYQQAQQEIAERKRTEDLLQRRATQLMIVNNIGEQIAAMLELDGILERAVSLIHENFGYHHVAIFITNHEQGKAIMKTMASSYANLFPLGHALALGQGMVGWVAQQGRHLLANDIRSEPHYVDLSEGMIPTRSELSVPIRIGSEITGVLDVQSPRIDAFDGNDIIVIETLAGQIATAIENARLYGAAQQELMERTRTEASLRREHSLLEHIAQASPVLIVMLNREGRIIYANQQAEKMLASNREEINRLFYNTREWNITDEGGEAIPDRDTTFQKVMATGQPVYNEQRRAVVGGQTLHVSINAAPFYDTAGEIEGAIAIISDITSMVQAEKAQEQYVKRLETLHEIDQSILIAETSQAVAESALTHLTELIPFQRASVAIFNFEQNEVDVLASFVTGQTNVRKGLKVPIQDYGIDEALTKGQIAIINDVDKKADISKLQQILRSEGIRSILSVPLMSQGSLIGALNLGAPEPSVCDDQCVEIAHEVAAELAIAVQHARLRERDQRHAEELEQRVADRTAELRSAYEEMQILSRVKDEFVSNVSHELRTPISSIKTYLHLFNKRPDKREKYTETLKREMNRLEHLIESLLTLSRFDQDRVEGAFTPVDLNALVEEYVGDRMPLAEEKELSLSADLVTEMPTVAGDRQMLGEVLGILMTNALSYTPSGGHVAVGTKTRQTEDGWWACVSVCDNGWGISPEECTHLFERFYRGNAANEMRISGTGLGLSIAHEIIALHHGHIEVSSDGILGHNTEFSVWLPVREQTTQSQWRKTARHEPQAVVKSETNDSIMA
jgi:PAS domain S-box-containing protein